MVRVVGDGMEPTIMSTKDALVMAYNDGLDLVMISPTANPPVCKIIEYQKYVYEQKKKEIEQQRALKIYADRAKENLDIINDLFVSGFWYEEFNEQGTVKNIYWSDSFRKILGFSDEKEFPNEVESFFNRVHPDDKTEALKHIDDFIKNKNEYDVTSRIMKKDGKFGLSDVAATVVNFLGYSAPEMWDESIVDMK